MDYLSTSYPDIWQEMMGQATYGAPVGSLGAPYRSTQAPEEEWYKPSDEELMEVIGRG